MSLVVRLVKDSCTYHERSGSEYVIPFGSTYTVDVSLHDDIPNDDVRYRVGLAVDGSSVGYSKMIKKAMSVQDDGGRRVTFNGSNTNSDGTERAAFVVIAPPELKDVAEELDCGVVVAWAERGRYVDDEPEVKHVSKKTRVAGVAKGAASDSHDSSSSSSSLGAPAATGCGERFAAKGFLNTKKFKADEDARVLHGRITYGGV